MLGLTMSRIDTGQKKNKKEEGREKKNPYVYSEQYEEAVREQDSSRVGNQTLRELAMSKY